MSITHLIRFVIQGRSINIIKLYTNRSIFRSLQINSKKKRKKRKAYWTRFARGGKFSTITRAYLLGRNEELFELYPRRGSSNSIDNWPRSKTFLLKLRREKQINPFQRFVKRQESAWHGGRGGGRRIEPIRQYRSRIYEAWILQLVRCNVIIRIRSHRSHGHASRFRKTRIVWKPFSPRSISRHA